MRSGRTKIKVVLPGEGDLPLAVPLLEAAR